MLAQLVPAWNGIVLMDAPEIVIIFCWHGLGIVRNRWGFLNPHMAHAGCVKFLMVHRWAFHFLAPQ
jgi:hypothetical protein